MFLTAADVAHLTGRKTRRRQIDALRAMGVPFLVNALGWPVVTIAAVEGRQAVPAEPTKPEWRPAVLQRAA